MVAYHFPDLTQLESPNFARPSRRGTHGISAVKARSVRQDKDFFAIDKIERDSLVRR